MPNYTTPDDLILQERDDLNYFLGNPPSWMLRNGIMVVAFVFGLLLWLSYLIKYPDTVACRVVLTTEHPPIRVLAQASGRVAELLVKENEVVEVGKILCALENTAEWRDVLRLESLLLNNNNPLSILAQNGLKLGSLQTIYSTFTQNAKDFSYFVNNNGVATKTQHLQNQITSLRALNQNLAAQKDIQRAEITVTERDYSRQKQLHTEGVISDMEFDKANSNILQQRRQIEATEANFINNGMQIQTLESQISDLAQSKNDNQNTKQLTSSEDTHRCASSAKPRCPLPIQAKSVLVYPSKFNWIISITPNTASWKGQYKTCHLCHKETVI